MQIYTAQQYRDFFKQTQEFAVIDTRPIDDFYRGHLLASSNIPIARIESDIEMLLPNRRTKIVLCDWATAHHAESVLNDLGYQDVGVIEGGLSGWHLAGGRIYPGWNVIGKAFGDYVEKTRGTPTIGSDDLKGMMDSADPPLILDTRSDAEHREFCLPGALHCPNGETILRAQEAIDDPHRQIVMHCAGRTRGIMGAQTLIEAGVRNPVCSLGNGALEWANAGYEFEYGACRPVPMANDISVPVEMARSIRETYAIPTASKADLTQWSEEIERSGLYVIDIRTEEQYLAGTWPGAKHVPGGQLLQHVDRHIVSRGGRIVLLDTENVRAVRIASWIHQMGYPNVYTYSATSEDLVVPAMKSSDSACNDLSGLKSEISDGTILLLDCRSGVKFRQGHVSGAYFFGGGDVEADEAFLPKTTKLVLHGDEERYTDWVAKELRRHGRIVEVRLETHELWLEAGFEIVRGFSPLRSVPHDAIYDLEERDVWIRDSYDYLKWRVNLFEILSGDPGAPYMNDVSVA